MTNKREIQILFLAEAPTDVVMVHHELRRGGLDFRSKRVGSRDAYLRELEHELPDLILADRGLSPFDGFAALALARDKCPEVPFIFVTSALGEQMTIEAFERGANGYVLKSELARLVPVVQGALGEGNGRSRGVTHPACEPTRQSRPNKANGQNGALKDAILETALGTIISIDDQA